jgi:signal transduction histidine kinase/DNA-binding response OmpR family regulator/ligand-binding sensor domain-containing protein
MALMMIFCASVSARKYFFFWVILFPIDINCLSQSLIFSPVEGREQLNEEHIRNLIQLKDGRLCVFTEGMLNLYDGSGFKTIHIEDENTIPLRNYTGFHHSYREGHRLWFKNGGKLAIIDLVNENTETKPENVLLSLGIDVPIIDLYVDSEEDIWVLTNDNVLLCKEREKKTPSIFLNDSRVSSSPGDPLYDVVSVGNEVYLFYKSGILRCFDRFTAKELYSKNIVSENANEFDDWLHVTQVNEYLYIVRGGYYRGQLVRYNTLTRLSTTLIQADDYWLNCFAANKIGDFYMSCRRGIWYFKSGADKGRLIDRIDLRGGSSIRTEISTIYFDSQDGFWIGTLNKGLYYYHPDRFRFQNIGKVSFGYGNSHELQVTCFEELNDKEIYIGTNYSLLKATRSPDGLGNPTVILNDITCNHILKDKNGSVWIGTSKGLYRSDENGRVEKVLPHAVNYIYQRSNSLYVCTFSEGILNVEINQEKIASSSVITNIPDIKQIVEWNSQFIGLSGRGPFILDTKDNSVSFPLDRGYKRPAMFQFTNHRYTCLLKDSGNDLWLGTYDGLTVWNDKEQKLYQLRTSDGLVNNSIKAIVEDKDHSFWVTTSMGISHIVRDTLDGSYQFTIQNYNQYNGVIDHAFAERSIFLSSNTTLFAGGLDGMNILQPENKRNGLVLSPILLYLKVLVNRDDSKLTGSMGITYKRHLRLNYFQNFFSITFSGLNYVNPSQTYYRFKLDGIDENWREQKTTSGLGEATYTSTPPGAYTFIVQSSPDGTKWSGEAKAISITIDPPFWKTGYADAIYILSSLLLITFIAFRITIANRKRRRKQQEEAIERAKTDFITNISHELRTPLTLIMTPLRALIGKVSDPKLKSELLQIDNNSQVMLDTVNQLLDFKKMDSGNETLHRNFYENLLFIQELCNQYAQLACDKQINFISEIANEEFTIFIDRQKVTRIVSNLLSNAINFTPAGGSISITARVNDAQDQLSIIVKDTGIGIDKDELKNIFDRFYQAKGQNNKALGSGIGLFMVKHYAQLHDGSVLVESEPGVGTLFKVVLSVKDELQAASEGDSDNTELRKTILIAEDNKAFRQYLTNALKSIYHIITAENGKEAYEKAIKFIPDLIVTDIMMPEMTGTEFCRALRNEVVISHIPVLMLTGRNSDEARYEGYESGADAYLVKPFDFNILSIRIEKLLKLRELRKIAFVEEKDVKTEDITTNPLDKKLLDEALRHVNSNLKNPEYSVEKFSDDMNMDRTGLYRKLVALTGLSPTGFIRTIRLKKAADMLTSTSVPITEIAEESGFSSVSYFTKCFHEAYSKTPSQYRAENI